MTFCCPACHGELVESRETVRCAVCAAVYARTEGILDFSLGAYYDQFTPGQQLSGEHRRGLESEVAGARWRIEEYYAPKLRGMSSVLDCGCGNGVSVDALMSLGFDAWGIDLSALRRWQWRERVHRGRLAVADALALPFPDAAFDAVISCGVLEHIGVVEEGGDSYRVAPRPDRDGRRRRFMSELLRVTRSGGRIFVDCPNGAFPIDFWHGRTGGSARFHRRDERFLPTFAEIRALAGDADVIAHSPHRRFAFRQVGRHWYGRLLAVPMTAYFALAGGAIAASALNPYLVAEIKKPPEGGSSSNPRAETRRR